MDYLLLNLLAGNMKTVKIWRRPDKVYDWPVSTRPDLGYPPVVVERSEVGVTIYASVDIAGWTVGYELDFDPENMPETIDDFWQYVNTHLFIRLDNPETTVPPPTSEASKMLNLVTVLRARWFTMRCPYIEATS